MSDIKIVINNFFQGKKPEERDYNERNASFDYCYNYFYSFRDKRNELANNQNMQMSCLQLGFFLASWGMFRGKCDLLQRSIKHFEKLIKAISKMPRELWEIDVNNYNEGNNIQLLLECKQKIIEALGEENNTSDTLVTKIMLGVFANVPAYDTNFKKFLKKQGCCQIFNKKSLEKIKEFYKKKKKDFDSFKIKTLNFYPNQNTEIIYTKAKLVDMYGFEVGKKG